MDNFNNLLNKPLRLKHNRVWRPFTGGMLLDRWQGVENPRDGNKPEEWVASTLEARNMNSFPDEGLSRVESDSCEAVLLRDVINSDPAAFLGKGHVEKYGNNMAVLVKILDSYSRLMIQVHPDRKYAKNILNSDFGKTEAWHILDARSIDGQEPYVLLGFKPGMSKEKWKHMFEKQDTEGMINALHKFTVKAGDTFLIEGGVPHAAGAGCFFIEIQEPTDYTMRTERTSPSGLQLDDFMMHQGVGFEQMLDCFNYDSFSGEEILDKWYKNPVANREEGTKETYLISPDDSSYFSMSRLEIEGAYGCKNEHVFSIAVVVSGKGKLLWDGGEMEIAQSDEIFLPAGIGDIIWHNAGGQRLNVIRCYPPRSKP